MSILKRIGLVIIIVTATIGVVAVGAIFIMKSETRQAILEAIKGPYADGRDASWHTPAGEELIRANNQHFFIAHHVAQCFPDVNFAWDQAPAPKIVLTFMLGLQPSGEVSWDSRIVSPDANVKLTNYQRTTLTLSNALSTNRSQLALQAADSNASRYWIQISIIIIGALTTIFVSIKAILVKASKYSMLIGISAIVLAAVGTALSSVNSFIGPGESFARAERTLVQARQLHLDLGFLVAGDKDLCGAEFDPDKSSETRTKKITEISDKLKEIIGLSQLGSGSPASTSQSQGQTSAGR